MEDLSAALRRLLVHQKQKADPKAGFKPKRLFDALSVRTTAVALGVVDLNPSETQ